MRWTPLALLLLTAACAPAETGPPVPDSTLVNVLVELHVAEGAATLPEHDLPHGLRDSVLHRYGIDSTAYRRTLVYYTEHPEAYLDVYEQVLDRLNQERPLR